MRIIHSNHPTSSLLPVFDAPGDLDTARWGRQGGTYSDDAKECYRWSYARRWSDGPLVAWILLNPATGDSEGRARPTLKRMVDWSRANLGAGGIVIVNLFAWRATKPQDLVSAARCGTDVVGERNDEMIRIAAAMAAQTIAAWGADGRLQGRGDAVVAMLRGANLRCLDLTQRSKQPRHPLYVPAPWTLRPVK